jgi:hypothetical protein
VGTDAELNRRAARDAAAALYPGTNHEPGRAMDIGAVDGQRCDGRRSGPCADLLRELAAIEGDLRSTELIYCWDPDGPADPRGFAAPITATTSTGGWTRDHRRLACASASRRR